MARDYNQKISNIDQWHMIRTSGMPNDNISKGQSPSTTKFGERTEAKEVTNIELTQKELNKRFTSIEGFLKNNNTNNV